ncbi:DnaJ domain-containing protein [Sphingomonas daechungensis]|uniref:DnaJ domain-containing protein n=1 Tax=Sphingomonas daechungensis TaxID=1176646 RepID=A0ABX6SXP2_9SPHN|nr:DnaJ domain-containing protein [Sphingomonas daechungensis]QNP42364.1 DnaJ domain-containing protein [Sphingomonas daechungensis]
MIEAAYKALIRKYHPDRAGDNQRIRDINAAYAVLKSPVKRRAYDAKLKLFPSRELARADDVPVRPAPGSKPRAGQPKAAPSEPLKTCPECHADVRRSAKRCRHCGFQFWSGILGTQSRDIGCASVVILLLVLMLMYCSGPGATGDAVTDTGNQAETTGEASIPGPFQGVWGLSQQECGRGITTKTVTANDIDGGKVVKVEELSDQQIKVEYEFTEGGSWRLGHWVTAPWQSTDRARITHWSVVHRDSCRARRKGRRHRPGHGMLRLPRRAGTPSTPTGLSPRRSTVQTEMSTCM